MTPKEKAKELFDKMEEQQEGYYLDNKQNTKNCALVAVGEILNEIYELDTNIKTWYWKQVKQEIEKL